MLGRVFLGLNSTKQGLMCLAQGHKAVTPVRLEPAALRSRVKQSTIEPLHTAERTSVQGGLEFRCSDNLIRQREKKGAVSSVIK